MDTGKMRLVECYLTFTSGSQLVLLQDPVCTWDFEKVASTKMVHDTNVHKKCPTDVEFE